MATVFDKSLKIRADDSILKWVEQLAKEAERTPSQFLRDLIFYMRMTQSGPIICRHLIDQRIHYRPFKAAVKAPEMKRPVFPWDHNLPEQSEG